MVRLVHKGSAFDSETLGTDLKHTDNWPRRSLTTLRIRGTCQMLCARPGTVRHHSSVEWAPMSANGTPDVAFSLTRRLPTLRLYGRYTFCFFQSNPDVGEFYLPAYSWGCENDLRPFTWNENSKKSKVSIINYCFVDNRIVGFFYIYRR